MKQEKVLSKINDDVDRFNSWAAQYERSSIQRFYFRPVHAKMMKLLTAEMATRAPACILDIGCGTGRFLRLASTVWPDAQLYGVDPASNMISEAMRLTPAGNFKLGFAENIPLPDASADLIVSSLSFHHWADHQKGIHEIARVLRPHGVFCLADHSFTIASYFGENVKTGTEISGMVTNAGLEIRHQAGMGWQFVLITLAKK